MNQPDIRVAEQLWVRAHEAIKRGNLPQAVRDLAKSFEILRALQDPRMRQVHAKWVATHKAYLEEKEAGGRQPQASVDYRTLQAQAETAANSGQLGEAIRIYEQVVEGQPENELALERIAELKQAQHRAVELGASAPAEVITEQPAPVAEQPAIVAQEPAADAEQPVVLEQEPAVAQEPAAVVEQPVVLAEEPAPAAATDGVDQQVAFLESLLGRVQERRRPAS